ncbi:hypothetical protein NDU88_003223 [Pleurodeles waltl]|uniref:Uncharacterized protein n=1 Tax=Pleurodeles waltl TaxID=8319 RepID=A0AAV7RCJ0_PLEWA|nr:hypothetical protein NDU88_003223 [Pleurodeles waltl]
MLVTLVCWLLGGGAARTVVALSLELGAGAAPRGVQCSQGARQQLEAWRHCLALTDNESCREWGRPGSACGSSEPVDCTVGSLPGLRPDALTLRNIRAEPCSPSSRSGLIPTATGE